MVQSQKILSITAGKEHQLKILNLSDNVKDDIFYPIYCQAFKEVEKILRENRNKNKDLSETANNIIAFCGERGQGKSSAMITFSKFLRECQTENFKNEFSNLDISLYQINFHVLRRIDPTELENCHSILSVIISRIFHDFKEKVKANESKTSIIVNELLQTFQRCYKNIDIIKSTNAFEKLNYGYEDDLEKLSMLSDSANIKKDFADLVNQFLNYMCEKQDEKILVIQIDDTDLNVEKAYEIVEDIRKYFMIPNVIVLMATNAELLTSAIEQNFQMEFEASIKNKTMLLQSTREMATQYINKLMPGNRRIILPDIKIEVSQNGIDTLKIRYINNTKEKKDILNYYDIYGNKMESLQDLILRYIFEKTGLIFINPDKTLHRIIPNNTRNIANFLSVLNGLEDIPFKANLNDITKKDIQIRLSNLEKFESFFLNTWIETNVDHSFIRFINEWSSLPITLKNQRLINYIKKQYLSFSENSQPLNNRIRHNTYSLYDVIYNLEQLEKLDSQEITARFVFAIKTLYTILLNKQIWQQLLLEKLYAKEKGFNILNDQIVSFIGDIFGDNIDSLIRRDRSRISRAKGISIIQIPIIKKYYDNTDCENVLIASSLLGDVFSGIRNDETLKFTFDISNPLMRLIQPFGFIQTTLEQLHAKLNSETLRNNIDVYSFNIINKFNEEYGDSRLASIFVVSNIDLLEKLTSDLRAKRRSHEEYIEYIRDFYDRIKSSISEIDYLCLQDISFDSIKETFSKSKDFLSTIFEYRNTEEVDNRKRISSYIEVLDTYKNTNTIQLLKERTIKTLKIFYSIKEQFNMIDLKLEISSLQDIDTYLLGKKELSKKSCLNRQAIINKMINSAKDKLSDYT